MNAAGEEHIHEIVIIKRRKADDHDGHHGGVWKIAYADFMTAMMAFFLVMWLINAANEETRSQVASYFNPVKLIDSRTNTKGLQDLESGADGPIKQEPVTGNVKSTSDKKPEPDEKHGKEEAIFSDPYKVLAEIAAKSQKEEQPAPASESDRAGQRGGEAFLDPFDPQTWNRSANAAPAGIMPMAAEVPPKENAEIKLSAMPPQRDQAKALQPLPEGKKGETSGPAEKPLPSAEKKAAGKIASGPETAERDAKEIRKEIDKAIGKPGIGASPNIEVKTTQEGVLISLTDKAGFGMFEIASAEPEPVLVRYLEEIGKILKERNGKVIISGHTDSRPFRSQTYDNWRLSSARAHMAYYMLVRGGIDEKRVERIEGHADRDLKLPSDPEAAENRRIEILLREDAT